MSGSADRWNLLWKKMKVEGEWADGPIGKGDRMNLVEKVRFKQMLEEAEGVSMWLSG